MREKKKHAKTLEHGQWCWEKSMSQHLRFSTVTININKTAEHPSPESPQIPQLLVDSATLAQHGNPQLYIKPVCRCNRSDIVHFWMHRLKYTGTKARSRGSFCLNHPSVLEKNPFISLSPYLSWKYFWKIPHDFFNWPCWVERNH